MIDGTEPPLRFVVAEAEDGLRLDHLLTARCPDLSRSRVQKAVDADAALVDGRPRPSRYRVAAGQTVEFAPPPLPPSEAVPEDIPLTVVHRDEEILVVDKEAGMVVHPAPGHYTGTLVNAVLHLCGELPGGDGLRPGIVHRLDKDTSGLLVVALSERAHRGLADQLRDRTLGRVYRTVSWGSWRDDAGVLTGEIARHATRRDRMAVVPGGRAAITRYEVREDYGFCQLCEVRLETGRTHQIRVQFAAGGHPVVGDPVYGDDARVKQVHPLDRDAALRMLKHAERQMLHAARLTLRHPGTGEEMSFTSELPADMARVVAILREHCGDARL